MIALRRILVPVDFSECSDAAIEHALYLRKHLDARVSLLHVWESPVYTGVESMLLIEGPSEQRMSLAEYVRTQAERAMEKLLEDLAARGEQGLEARVVAGDPASTIVDASAEHDLVVMGTHGRGVIAHLLLGSVAERVVRKARCAVLTVHSPATSPATPKG